MEEKPEFQKPVAQSSVEERQPQSKSSTKKVKVMAIIISSLVFTALLITVISISATISKNSPIYVRPESYISPNISNNINNQNKDIFQVIISSNPSLKNLILSPLSLYCVLSIAQIGSKGNTSQQILNIIGDQDTDSVIETNKNIGNTIDSISSLEIANGIFSKFTPESDYIKMIKELKSDAEKLNSASQVNNWVRTKTHNKIDNIVDNIDGMLMILVNALYFKNEWVDKFDSEDTYSDNFYITNSETTQVKFMSQTGKFKYYEDEDMQLIVLPYKTDNMSSFVILPKKDLDINDFILNKVNSDYVLGQVSKAGTTKVNLKLPKIKSNSRIDLTNILKGMGMVDAFNPQADFTGISKDTKLMVSVVLQKTYLKVDEDGTEAAAVTMMGMVTSSYEPEYPIDMKCDRPFIFGIIGGNLPEKHRIVFISKIGDPSQ